MPRYVVDVTLKPGADVLAFQDAFFKWLCSNPALELRALQSFDGCDLDPRDEVAEAERSMDERGQSFTCPRCGKTSYNVNDVEQRYCGACHAFTGERFDPDWVVKPGDTLAEYAEEHELSLGTLAQRCRLHPVEVEGVVTGKQRITEQVAERLAHGTGISARMWLNLERNYREGLAAGKREV